MAGETLRGQPMLDVGQWSAYQEMYAFVGNEVLTPMNRSGNESGLDPLFWSMAPIPANDEGTRGLARLKAYALAAKANEGDERANAAGMLQASVEFTHLFIGPPRPVADPWETMHGPRGDKHVGFGRATVAMRNLIAREGLVLSNENRQYEDHLGIELLYLSVLCEKAAREAERMMCGESVARDADEVSVACEAEGEDLAEKDIHSTLTYAWKVAWFVDEHPLRWIESLRDSVDADRPEGYYSALLEYVHGLLKDHATVLKTQLP